MTKKYLFPNLFIVCLMALNLTTISGCAVKSKSDKIIGLQKKRIHQLEKQLNKKNQLIGQLKANKWVNQTVHVDESVSLAKLQSLVKKEQWVQALKESSRLKSIHPQSMNLRYMRIKIFSKMGLKDQAMKERLVLKSLRTQRVNQSLKR